MVPCLDFCFNRPWAHAGDRLSPGRQSLKGVFVISFDLNACFMAPYAFQENPRYSIILIFAPYLSPNSSPSPFHFTAFDSLSPHPPIRRTRDQIQIGPDMAQKREKEGTEFKVQENLNICTPPQSISTAPPHVPASRAAEGSDPKISSACEESRASSGLAPDPAEKGALKRPREVNRCSGSGCRKRIGLMGFMCRCGEVFCSEHRYSDRHVCSYDYKAAGREAIARENPVIRAAKILKV